MLEDGRFFRRHRNRSSGFGYSDLTFSEGSYCFRRARNPTRLTPHKGAERLRTDKNKIVRSEGVGADYCPLLQALAQSTRYAVRCGCGKSTSRNGGRDRCGGRLVGAEAGREPRTCFQNVSERVEGQKQIRFQNVSEHVGQEHFRTFQNVSEHFRTFQNISERFRTFENDFQNVFDLAKSVVSASFTSRICDDRHCRVSGVPKGVSKLSISGSW